MITLVLIFTFLLFYSYFVFPQSLTYISSKKRTDEFNLQRKIVVIISAYNERDDIRETIKSIFLSSNESKIDCVFIGDDGSTDGTSDILEALQVEFPKIKLIKYHRFGKPNIVNDIVKNYALNTKEHLLVFMDANISVEKNCIEQLEKALKYKGVGMVGASVFPKRQLTNFESEYILRENRIKSEESRTSNYVVGVFGACYAMLGELYCPIPSNYITDDLFQTFSTIELGKNVLYEETAKVYESITANIESEFRRKKRYAAGNFQILLRFWRLIIPSNSSLLFVYTYFFHKIVRWISPIFFFGFWVVSILGLYGYCSKFIFILGTTTILFLLMNYYFQRKGNPIHNNKLYYFLVMNFAILLGFFNFIKGIKSNVWERSERN